MPRASLAGDTPPVPALRLMARLFWPYRGRILLFAATIALGIGSLFAVSNLLGLVERTLAEQARSLMSADLAVSSWRPLDDDARGALEETLAGERVRRTDVLELASMARAGDTPFLVTVRGVEPTYPLHGDIGADGWEGSLTGDACLIDPSMAAQRGLGPGDTLELGRARFRVAAVLSRDPDRATAGVFAFAPRVIVPLDALAATGLVDQKSRVRRTSFIAVDAGAEDPTPRVRRLAQQLTERIGSPNVEITSFVDAQPTTSEMFRLIATFFAMVALVTLVLGTLGVVVGVLSLLNDHLEIIATLRCLGVDPRSVSRAYLGLCAGIGLLGGVLGVAVGAALDALAVDAVAAATDLPLTLRIGAGEVARALVLGVGIAVAFNLASVRALARVAPRDMRSPDARPLALRRLDLALLVVGALLAVGAWLWVETRSPILSAGFALGLAATAGAALLLVGAGFLVLGGLHRALLRVRSPLVLRHGILQVVRNRRRSLAYLITLGLGLTLVVALGLIQHSIEAELQLDGEVPNLFLVDVQTDQAADVEAFAGRAGATRLSLSPLVRARLVSIDGQAVVRDEGGTREERRRQRMLSREYNLTGKDALNASETVVEGRLWEPGTTAVELSLERRFADRLGVGLGGRLTFDVQGRPLDGVVTSIRQINWLSLLPNFFVVLPAQVLEGAPQTLIGSLRLPGVERMAEFQRELFAAHPNISVIDLGPLFGQVRRLLGTVGATIQLLAAVCAGVGLLILLLALRLGRPERVRQAAILRALGFDTRQILGLDLVEHAAVGLIAAVTVLVLATTFAAVALGSMDVRPRFPPGALAAAALVAIALPVVAALLSNTPAYRRGVRAAFSAG
ncbi:MAG: permease [Myxococcales bacterium]